MSRFQIDAIRLSPGGTLNEHITHVFGPAFGSKHRFDAVTDLYNRAHTYFTQRPMQIGQTEVGRVAANQAVLSRDDYLRTYANGKWDDNLLSLPRK